MVQRELLTENTVFSNIWEGGEDKKKGPRFTFLMKEKVGIIHM